MKIVYHSLLRRCIQLVYSKRAPMNIITTTVRMSGVEHDGLKKMQKFLGAPTMSDALRLAAVEFPALLKACEALQMEAAARGCGLRIADESIRRARKFQTGAPRRSGEGK